MLLIYRYRPGRVNFCKQEIPFPMGWWKINCRYIHQTSIYGYKKLLDHKKNKNKMCGHHRRLTPSMCPKLFYTFKFMDTCGIAVYFPETAVTGNNLPCNKHREL